MKDKHKIINYPSRNKKTETYQDGETFVTKHFYDAKDAYVKEYISQLNETKEIKYFTEKGVLAKLEHFVQDKREGQEIKYIISKADRSIKSTKEYKEGKLHGECITYNLSGEIVKHEVYATGKLTLKYLREDIDSNDITNVEVVSESNIPDLPTQEYDKLQTYLNSKNQH